MFRLKGKSAYKTIACGSVYVMGNRSLQISEEKVSDVEAEVSRLEDAIEIVKTQMDQLYDKALAEIGAEAADVFQVHRMILEDKGFLDSILGLIREESMPAETAITIAGEQLAEKFQGGKDAYMNARRADIEDITKQILQVLKMYGKPERIHMENAIVIAEDILPSELLQMDRTNVAGIVTIKGSELSHTAIIARMMGIPYLAQVTVEKERIYDGMEVVVDTYKNEVIFSPTEEMKREARERICSDREKRNSLEILKGKESLTSGGKQVKLYANISRVEDVEEALKNDAEGIGLFRTEFLCLEKHSIPTEEEQFEVYKKVLMKMGRKPVYIRTFDIREDKKVFEYEKDETLRTQLRALLRAALFGNLFVIYPMICDVDEIEYIKSLVSQAQNELKSEGRAYGAFRQGIMVETKEAVNCANELAQMVDFFSIGTNDLQRENPKEEVLSMIETVIGAGHRYNIPVGICGELGANSSLTERFIQMGIDELSMAPIAILPIRKTIRDL